MGVWKTMGGFDLTVPPAERARIFINSFPPAPTPDPTEISVESIQIDGQFRALVVRPVGSAPLPVILAFHGGGGVVGTPE